MDLGALFQKFVLGNQAADVIPGVNVGQATGAKPYTATTSDGHVVNVPQSIANSPGSAQNIASGMNTTPQGGNSSPTQTGPTAQQIAAQQAAAAKAKADVAANPVLASLNTLDTILGNKNQQSHDAYAKALASYDSQDALDKQAHDDQVTQNDSSLASNNMAALLNAAHGGEGLRAVLSSLGALAGTGENVVHKLTGLAANSDAGAAKDTFSTNATNLNHAWQQTDQQEHQRRSDADSELFNEQQNNKADVLNSRKSMYDQLANIYGTDTADGVNWAGKSAALAPEIAGTTRAQVAGYQAPSALYSKANLANYLAGTKNLNVNTSGGDGSSSNAAPTPINSPLFSNTKKQDQLAGVA